MELPNGITYIDYSEKQRVFHYDLSPSKYRSDEWSRLMAMELNQAEEFFVFMDKKYVKSRKNGKLSTLRIVKIELELFCELRKTRRNLVNH